MWSAIKQKISELVITHKLIRKSINNSFEYLEKREDEREMNQKRAEFND